MNTKKICEKRAVLTLFFLCWFIYFSSYLARRNFPAAMSGMILDGFLQKSQAGTINTFFFFSYGIGQLVNGVLGDRFSPKKMVLFGVVMSAIANITMGFAQSYPVMLIAWAVNGYALSMLWPPMIRVFADMLGSDNKVKSTINISTAVAVGSLGSYVLSASMLSIGGWRYTFYSAAAVQVIAAIVWAIVFPLMIAHQDRYGVAEGSNTCVCSSENKEKKFSLKWLLCNSAILVITIPIFMQGMLRDGVTTWVPTFIAESFLTSPDFAVLFSTLLPLVNLIGPYSAHFMYRHVFKNEVITSGFFFLLSTLFLVGFIGFGRNSIGISIVLFALITTCMEAINVMFVSVLPLRYSAISKTATVSGFMNFITYVGASISTFGIGVMVDYYGWGGALKTWCMISLIGLLTCLLGKRFQMVIPEK